MKLDKPDSQLERRDAKPHARTQFTIKSILVITLLMAITSTALGQLWRIANGQIQDVGPFVLVTSMAPLGVMICVYWLFRLTGKF